MSLGIKQMCALSNEAEQHCGEQLDGLRDEITWLHQFRLKTLVEVAVPLLNDRFSVKSFPKHIKLKFCLIWERVIHQMICGLIVAYLRSLGLP